VAEIELVHLSKVYGNDVVAVRDLNLHIGEGEFVVLVGPSGCGKTTALRMIAGLEEISAGEIRIGGKVVNDLAPRNRDIAMVFQSYALYPHKSVYDNLAFGLRMRKVPKEEQRRRVEEIARVLGLADMLNRRPAQLSGGQRQRVAMGRAIVREPKAFLMDEPLSNLDAKLRVSMRSQLSALHARLGTTTIYVTHDQVEAMTLGQRVAVMRDGRVQQVDTPQALYRKPANLFVAAFIGSPAMNLVDATIAGGHVEFAGFRIPLSPANRPADGAGRVVLGIRPEAFEDAAFADPSLPQIDVTVDVIEELGPDTHVLFTIEAPPVNVSEVREAQEEDDTLLVIDRALFNARVDARTAARVAGSLRLAVNPDGFHFFDPATGATLTRAQAPALAEAPVS
jgi:multiple sugar transport system ATP-binding protein